MPLAVHVVSGPIGAGKSSILRAIQACTQYESSVRVFTEDTQSWQYYLERFYADPAAYGFLFQKEVEIYMHNLTKHLEQLQEQSGTEQVIVFVERSPLDVLHVFLELIRTKISTADYNCLVHAMTRYAERPVWSNAQYYHVYCPPRVCIERIQLRDRKGEEHIDEEYVHAVHSLYDKLAVHTKGQTITNYGRRNSLLASVAIVTQCLHNDPAHP